MNTKFLSLLFLATAFLACDDDTDDAPNPPDFTLSFNLETNEDQMGVFSDQKMAVLNGEVWSVGGYNSYHQSIHSDVWKSSNGRSWQSVTSGQFPDRKGHSLTVIDNKLWVIGGYRQTAPNTFLSLRDVWFSADGEAWTLATDDALQTGSIGYHSTLVFNNQLYIIKDGDNEGMAGCSVWTSNNGINWTRLTGNAFSSREFFTATVFNNEMYVIGGLHLSNYYNEIWKSADGINWTQVSGIDSAFPARANGKALVYDDKLWVLGGTNGVTSVNQGLWHTSNGEDWFSYTPLPSTDGITNFDALNYNDAIWVFGGLRQLEGSVLRERVGTINTVKKI
ncbi:hypothetical protein [Winogradskyella forsetii]|uniref:hypothetical protein n=1 Tax=Winogradskyella forsetii TaxID=2686077 RepID=UPI0015BDF4AF|nr:hypothetical protein [Winogradskyella forsetii]